MSKPLSRFRQRAERCPERPEHAQRRSFLICVVTAVLIIWFGAKGDPAEAPAGNPEDSAVSVGSAAFVSSPAPETSEPVVSAFWQEADLSAGWNLILVNREHPLPSDFAVTLAEVPGGQMDERAAPYLLQMIADAAQDGVVLTVCSAYRDAQLQASLFEREVSSYEEQGLGREESEQLAGQYVQPSSASEHQTGLAVDLVTDGWSELNEGFAQTPAYEWLSENAAFYGFAERYPKGREEQTGVAWEPWHYRFVGPETAETMQESGLCLEEYIAQLKERTER